MLLLAGVNQGGTASAHDPNMRTLFALKQVASTYQPEPHEPGVTYGTLHYLLECLFLCKGGFGRSSCSLTFPRP